MGGDGVNFVNRGAPHAARVKDHFGAGTGVGFAGVGRDGVGRSGVVGEPEPEPAAEPEPGGGIGTAGTGFTIGSTPSVTTV